MKLSKKIKLNIKKAGDLNIHVPDKHKHLVYFEPETVDFGNFYLHHHQGLAVSCPLPEYCSALPCHL